MSHFLAKTIRSLIIDIQRPQQPLTSRVGFCPNNADVVVAVVLPRSSPSYRTIEAFLTTYKCLKCAHLAK